MSELQKLKNIGKELDKQLNEIGIYTFDDLVNWGSQEAWLKIQQMDTSACINRLMALEGAIQNKRWHDLSDKDKKYMKEFYEQNK